MQKPIKEQVVVITGASSGIGRETARQFAARGASVVLAARNEEALRETERLVREAGAEAHVVVTDVGDRHQVQRLVDEAVSRFGRIDTWVNNAAVATIALAQDTEEDEIEQVIRVNLLGQIYGMKAVLPELERQGGGTIINIGSVESERALPYHAAYSASKHGVKGFTESFRMELQHQHIPVQVTLILPASINTPFFTQARNRLGGRKASPIPPIYQPNVVAEAILAAAERPHRDIYVGSSSKTFSLLQRLSPGLTDSLMLARGAAFRLQEADQPDSPEDSLFQPSPGKGRTEGDFGRGAMRFSPFTRFTQLQPNRRRAFVAAAAVGAVALLRRGNR